MEIKPLLPRRIENGVVQFAGNNINGVLNLAVEFNTGLPPRRILAGPEDLWVKRRFALFATRTIPLPASTPPMKSRRHP